MSKPPKRALPHGNRGSARFVFALIFPELRVEGGARDLLAVLRWRRYSSRDTAVSKARAGMDGLLNLSPEEWTAVRLSVRVATVAMFVSLPIGIGVAYVLARHKFPGKSLVDGIVLLPLILPPVVTGYLLLLTFGRRGLVGAFLAEQLGIVFSFRWTGAALACGVMGFPLMVRAIRLSIEAVDHRLEEAASTLGARPLWVFAFVTLPLIAPGIIAGMILSFAKAMGEFGATITFVSNIPGETQTLPSAIYTFTQVPGGEAGALRLTLVSIAISMAALVVSELMARWVGRKIWTE
jgi:molybdate transport system permease protein